MGKFISLLMKCDVAPELMIIRCSRHRAIRRFNLFSFCFVFSVADLLCLSPPLLLLVRPCRRRRHC